MATWEDVARLARELPEAEEATTYRQPSLKVHGKKFAWMSPHAKGALVVLADEGELPLLIDSRPDVYFTTPHYDGYPMLLIRLERADDDALRERLEDSWALVAPPELVDSFAAADG